MAASSGEDKTDAPVFSNSRTHSSDICSYPSEHDNIPSLDGVSEDTANCQLHAPETGYSGGITSGRHSESDYHAGITIRMQQMKLDQYEKAKTSGKKSIFSSQAHCKKKKIKITEIDPKVFLRVCNLLNIRRVLGGDYRTLAGHLGYTVMDIKIFESEKNAAESLLYDWDSGKDNYAEEVIKILEEMNRDDIVQLLHMEIKRKCRQCNCENCGSLS